MVIPDRGSRERPQALALATTLAALPFVLATCLASAAPDPPKGSYTTVPGPSRADATFAVDYRGAGKYHTVFHATPPNPGGKPDTNDAHDTSSQSWTVKFRGKLSVPTCGQPADGTADPCTALAGLDGARGPNGVSGRVRHKHVDGLYREFDRTVSCRLRKNVSPHRLLDISLAVRYVADSQSIGISVSNPVFTALSLFPSQCPKQGDSIDRIFDFYATPGFSFDSAFDADRWLGSGEVVVPVVEFHRSKTIRIGLGDTRARRPPKGCAVRDPSFERCRTGGTWGGVLTLKAQG